ncbi:ATP-grasp domain-containing protein [Endothiovibrio diazotrophicus]
MACRETPFAWLFDPRFDTLIPGFVEFLRSRGHPRPTPLVGHRLFPDAVPGEEGIDILRQRTPRELNRDFMAAWGRGELPAPGRPGGHAPLPVAAFTQDGLAARDGLALFGAPPRIVAALAAKTTQFRRMRRAGLPLPPHALFPHLAALRRALPALLREHGALVIQPDHSDGGEGAALVRTREALEAWHERRVAGEVGEGDSPLLATRYIPDAVTLSGHGLITRQGRVFPFAVDRLLLDGFRFDGFVHPPHPTEGPEVPAGYAEPSLFRLTARAGELLLRAGYWGYYCVDLLTRPDPATARSSTGGGPPLPLITEINVRFAGEAAFLLPLLDANPFRVLWGDVPPPPRPVPCERLAATKIRPVVGETYRPTDGHGSLEALLAGTVDSARVGFHPRPLRVERGHFLGLAGWRCGLQETDNSINSQYYQSRTATS